MGHIPKKIKLQVRRKGYIGKRKKATSPQLTESEIKIKNIEIKIAMLDESWDTQTLSERRQSSKQIEKLEKEIKALQDLD